ncbi:MAG: hypothetical protein JNJ61_04980 [Anaerolineae bacterium]|nr:hypothetical protein [Anaerolineae bacterium]
MNYLEPQGFLGTGASLFADLTLLAYILLIVPGMIAGFLFARMGKHRPQHKWTMITITVVNWLLIIFLMIVAYRFDVVGNIGSQPANPRYLMPTIHAVFGLPAQLLATYVIYRMLREDTLVARGKKRGESKEQLRKYWFLNAKPIMRLTLTLWLITSLLGVFNYLIRYEVLPIGGAGQGVPVATPEVTPETAPAATPDATPAAEQESPIPAATEAAEDEPAVTPEATP